MKTIVTIARVLSALFRPAYYPLVGFIILFVFTYMNIFPWVFKLWVLAMVYFFTVALPTVCTNGYRRLRGWSARDLRQQQRRIVPYAIHLCCYLFCMFIMRGIHLPRFMLAVLAVSLLVQAACLLVNLRWKVSMHSAGAGAVTGALMAYAQLFGFNPGWWLCGSILLCGLVMTSRTLLRQHTLWQVLAGALLGVLCGYSGIRVM